MTKRSQNDSTSSSSEPPVVTEEELRKALERGARDAAVVAVTLQREHQRSLVRALGIRYFLVPLIISFASRAHADCFTSKTAPDDAACVVMPRGKQRGVWFSLAASDKIEKCLLERPEFQKQVSELEAQTGAQLHQIELYKGVVKEQAGINSSLVAENEALQRQLSSAQESRDAWYRSPWLWYGAGVASTIAVAFAITQIAH